MKRGQKSQADEARPEKERPAIYAGLSHITALKQTYGRTPQVAPGYVGAAVGLLSQYIRVVKVSSP